MKDVIVIGPGKPDVKALKTYMDNKDVIIPDEPESGITINGQKYYPVQKENPKSGKMPKSLMMLTALACMSGYDMNDIYSRKLPPDIDIIKEYGLIQLKKSNLSRLERQRVIHIFESNWAKA